MQIRKKAPPDDTMSMDRQPRQISALMTAGESYFPRLYYELADWFHLLTAPEEYAEEAYFYLKTFQRMLGQRPETLLELGSGGGNMASHYKRHVKATLTDVSQAMLDLSRTINPDCEHLHGDMRTLQLGCTFDAVFVHDAVCYIATREDLQRVFETAFLHCKPGGAAVFAPDHVREKFTTSTDHGGHDGPDRSLRYLEWTTAPDPGGSTYRCEYAYLLHARGHPTRVEFDTHVCGLFGEAEWLEGLSSAGFAGASMCAGVADAGYEHVIFTAIRPR